MWSCESDVPAPRRRANQHSGVRNFQVRNEETVSGSPRSLIMLPKIAQTFAFGCKQKEEPQNALSSITRPVEITSDQKVGRSSVNNQSTFVDSAAGGRLAQVGLDKSNRKMATQSFCTMFLSGLQDVLFLGLSLLFFPLLRSLRRVWWDKPPDAWVAKGKGLGIELAYR
ncbi:hypothetical protein TEQG_06651 [Trichophyton equinum CBS 127.97]|uniref:Uncharacterized protein n=1 Tax=Trichophyton equinum (strain ATCC MYA-4606 / CBS 127.97) TaxID=559882 RepID=F2Q0J9_TRIEC|nr:hypothetical protein TEQG_06651 [Trichophyton equinum CBS 127.97]